MDKKDEMPKNENAGEQKEEEKEPKQDIPIVGDPKYDHLYPGLKSKNSMLNVLSFLPIKDLVECTKVNRYIYKIVMDEDTRNNRILFWDFSYDEEMIVNKFLNEITNDHSKYDDKLKTFLGDVKIAL